MATWLKESYLTQIADMSCVVMVNFDTLRLIKDLSYMSKIYPIVKSIYPDMTSLYITNNCFTEHIKSGKIELYSVEKNGN